MTAELVRGQNHPLSQVRLEIRVSAGVPVVAAATLSDENDKARGVEWVAHPGAPTLPGLEVSRQAATDHRLAVDLAAMPEAVHRVNVLLALPSAGGGPLRFGAVGAPTVTVTGLDGIGIARFTLAGLDAESAVVALELYRRQGAWKVRAVGQGYAGGLAALFTDQRLPGAAELAGGIQEAVARGLARSVPAPPPRTSDADRTRRTATPVSGVDQPGPSSQGAPDAEPPRPASPYDDPGQSTYGAQAPGGQGPSPYPDSGPEQQAGGAAAPGPSSAPGTGGIDYTHPNRRHTAPPPPPPQAPPAPSGQPARPVAGDAAGWSMDERLYNQVWGMFEDLARTTAAYRSAVEFADSRRDKELDHLLSDPRSRIGAAGDAAREAAGARHAQLVDEARAVLDRDLAQLTAEAEVVEPALPPAYARWDNPVWHGYRVPTDFPMALRLGDLHLPESVPLRIPMLARLPLERGLWIDSGPATGLDASFADSTDRRGLAMETAMALAARLLAVHPVGEFAVQVIDPAGSGSTALMPLVRTGVLAAPPAAGAAGVADVLARLTQRVDLVQMALRAGAPESLPPGLDTAQQLLVVNDFPHGFDDRAVNQLRYLADEGPSVGVHLVMVADREDASAYGPLLDPLWRSLMRLTPVPDDHLADPWVGHAWTYEPSLVPPGSQVLQHVLAQVAEARTKYK
ncbi:TerD family protein [Streptomyces brasiliensis]|uniref:Export associated protein n=1 Tax=Streptomyces brasiliensis TaxID=1954 RepID=A0A917KSX5_9ACTN|nr:TerD family protein [Streptomyces brasiliensis]GGJ26321.1 export associated protein [Streptomyces brasiliensis]